MEIQFSLAIIFWMLYHKTFIFFQLDCSPSCILLWNYLNICAEQIGCYPRMSAMSWSIIWQRIPRQASSCVARVDQKTSLDTPRDR